MADAAPPRAMRFWEEEMLAEYLAARYPDRRVLTRVRLGPVRPEWQDPTLTPEELQMLGASWRRWADAVIVGSGELLIVEAKMLPDPRDISQLQLYLALSRVTPELAAWASWPRRGLLVWGVNDAFSARVAVAQGLTVEIFKPSHWGEWLRSKREREGRKTRPMVTPRGSEIQ